MPNIVKVVTRWTGGNIGTGFTNQFFDDGVGTYQEIADAVAAFWKTLYGLTGQYLPQGITLSWQGGVDIVEPGTGSLVNTVPVTPQSNLTGLDVNGYASPAGGCVSWLTSAIIGGHRSRGRTFFVPVGGAGLQNNGTLSPEIMGQATNAATGLLASPADLVVWHRPVSQALGGGEANKALAFRITDQAAMLTSRR